MGHMLRYSHLYILCTKKLWSKGELSSVAGCIFSPVYKKCDDCGDGDRQLDDVISELTGDKSSKTAYCNAPLHRAAWAVRAVYSGYYSPWNDIDSCRITKMLYQIIPNCSADKTGMQCIQRPGCHVSVCIQTWSRRTNQVNPTCVGNEWDPCRAEELNILWISFAPNL